VPGSDLPLIAPRVAGRIEHLFAVCVCFDVYEAPNEFRRKLLLRGYERVDFGEEPARMRLSHVAIAAGRRPESVKAKRVGDGDSIADVFGGVGRSPTDRNRFAAALGQ
jgi:hypothetical protein